MTSPTCSNWCEQESFPYKITGKNYVEGSKLCNQCKIAIETEQVRCPCCNNKMRDRPRNQRFRRKHLKNVVRY